MAEPPRLLPVLMRLLGAKTVLAAGSFPVAFSGIVVALFHGELVEAYLMMALMGCRPRGPPQVNLLVKTRRRRFA